MQIGISSRIISVPTRKFLNGLKKKGLVYIMYSNEEDLMNLLLYFISFWIWFDS